MKKMHRQRLLLETIALFLVLFIQRAASKYTDRYYELHNIHRSMKQRDLSRIFGVDNRQKVPEYQVITPHFDGLFSNTFTRTRREARDHTEQPVNFNFGLTAFNIDFHLNLSMNKDLLGPNFKIEIKGKNSTVEKKAKKRCHYTGKVHGVKDSVAAVSTCKGLSGMFMVKDHDYFIEPVPDYLHNVHTVDTDYKKPHIIYRRSIEETEMFHETPSETFNRLWYRDRRSCGTQHDPHLKFKRSEEDESPAAFGDNAERYIEALVVVDQKMVNYHGEDAASQFALVVLNMVASLLRDGSIGSNLIILVVVKLELHTVDVAGLVINHHARNTLQAFGEWAQRSSDQDDRSDDHYDYAILLTRYNICADDKQPCDMLGLTQTGGMCNWPYSASVNEDNGLPLVYTVTHSIGHSLGMNHDGGESSEICPDNTFIMSSTISPDYKNTRNIWSRCSRNYLKQFLKKPQAHCLLDVPDQSRDVDYQKLDSRPGLLYDVKKQCEMQFGTGSTICDKDKTENICTKLSCTNPLNTDKCFTSVYPASDGTPCGPSKECFRGKCLKRNEIKPTDGTWGSWADNYSPCSRSCGGGVQYRIRHCNHPKPSDGGKYCEGEPRKFRLCNKEPCTNSLMTHRNTQCVLLNNRLFGEKKFEWEFKPSKIDSCKLGCFITGTQHGYDFGNVVDGTNCDQMDDSVVADKCINGQCVTVGCDGELGSHAKFDRCGVCNGDGSTCTTGEERSKIPQGAVGTGGIVDALKSLKDMGFDMGSLYGKSTLDLSSKRSGIPGKDVVSDFGWARIKSGCSVSCGGGIESITAECRRLDDGSPVVEEKCAKDQKPPTQQYPCKEDACPPSWQTSYWGDCSKTCNGGVKKRNVRCVQKAGTGIEYDIDGSLCTSTRPSDIEGCNKEPCPSEWIAQPFGECSTICGPGVQVRDVLCQKTLKDGSISTEDESECRKETKPPTEQKCNAHNPCPGDAGCGGIYTDERGNFTSPGYPNDYPNNMECVHIIQVPEGKVIQLQFDKMSVVAPDDKECKNDFVKVMDGDCVSRLGESKFCGKSIPPPFTSTTNRLCVKFFSDDSQNDEGFIAKYHAVDKPAQSQDICGSNITAPAGLISSPNYPEYYPPNEDCNITITTEEKPIKITFHAFDVGSDDCSTDFVYLTDGQENKKYCGQKIPPSYTSKQNPITVRFVSTNHAATLKPGFVATYTSGMGQDSSANSRQKISKTEDDDKKESAKLPTPQNQTEIPPENHNKTEKDMEDMKNEAKKPTQGNEQKKDLIPEIAAPSPSPDSSSKVSFVNVQPARVDEIAKEVIDKKKESELSPERKAYLNAIKDDTPAWIPEAEDYTTRRSNIARPPAPVVTHHTESTHAVTNIAPNYISRDRKSSIQKVVPVYEHNLDGQRGTCPKVEDLKCIRVLLSYPCKSDFDCRSGFACCSTSCSYGVKMCTPKVTRHCPLRDPFYSPHIACQVETDCPKNSPCCLDMSNRRYCRHMLQDTWKQ
ncbi:A disintegrin and metalloproteinase with thrombospondin motifs 6-like [Hydractinia symbiolongicarpus]|uniref:A disintegrin and metalloproteinase with thrombospondin motifs 6-like n=1 Tax=Hydractinia symbiolongicarpus TaxID=13093 RepID=UPI00254A5FE9|nr:A disintegrin and metalloproteinase with thrombospondin motifs 6-like [Hydractinia symbiolongicarpus]